MNRQSRVLVIDLDSGAEIIHGYDAELFDTIRRHPTSQHRHEVLSPVVREVIASLSEDTFRDPQRSIADSSFTIAPPDRSA
jgi:cellulose biosynthesis protein BcsQ